LLISEFVSKVLLLVTERRDSSHHKRNDSIYNPNKGYDSRVSLVAMNDIFQSHVKAVEILKCGPTI